MNPECKLFLVKSQITTLYLLLLARTGILTVALLAGDIGQSGLVPGRETRAIWVKCDMSINDKRVLSWAKRGAPLPTRYGDFIPLGRPAGGGRGVSEKVSGKVFR